MPVSRVSWGRTLAATGLLFVAVPALRAQSPADDQREAPEVTRLTIRGAKAVDPTELQGSISTSASSCRSLLLRPFCWIWKSHLVYERKYLDRRELQRDVLRIRVFYWKRGYRHTEVDTTVAQSGETAQVTFRITEGKPTVVHKIAVGPQTDVLSARDIRRSVSLRAGKPLDLLKLDSSVVSLSNKLWERGYADAIVRVDTIALDDSSYTADVAIGIDPRWKATVAELRITGNEVITPKTIRNSLTLHEGDIFRRSDVITSQRNLYESGLFRHAAILVPPQGDSTKIVEVQVREAPLREARVSGGFNTADFVQVDGMFRHYNFLGGARRLDLTGTVGNLFARQLNNTSIFKNSFEDVNDEDRSTFEQPTWQASAQIRQPWFQNPRNTLSLGVFAHRRATPSVFVDRGEGANVTFTREVADRTPVSATYQFALTRVEAGDLYFCVYYGVCDTPSINAQRSRQRLSPVALTASVDRTNLAFSPTSGIVGSVSLEHASSLTVSDYRYNRASAELASYYRVGRGVLAVHGRAGIVRAISGTGAALGLGSGQADDILHPGKRFYAGGSRSVRGFGENQLGPRALTIPISKLATLGCDTSFAGIGTCNPNAICTLDACKDKKHPDGQILPERDFVPRPLGGTSVIEANVEYRFPIWRALGGAAFVDAGAVGSAGLQSLVKGNRAVTPGAGIRYASPVGPIRVDIGFNPGIAEDLPVYTAVTNASGQQQIVKLDTKRRYDPVQSALDHLTFHFSIGQAF
jgi:outer membrane protein assembly complex protein YaeT